MVEDNAEIFFERLRAALNTQRIDDAVGILLSLHPVDRADVFNLMTDTEQTLLESPEWQGPGH